MGWFLNDEFRFVSKLRLTCLRRLYNNENRLRFQIQWVFCHWIKSMRVTTNGNLRSLTDILNCCM
uniref:Uncharacterized protein n=1 Tax=Meloidogyne enterolobii TaxID=390850 RepID=A0A6V7TQR7_MELEN|nr:unnamed protein product [Meloidogyne enterolobii]